MSPTSRTLKMLREMGYCAEVVEKWNRWAGPRGIRQDLFDCIDIVAIKSGAPIMGVQATSTSNMSARVNKSVQLPGLKVWLGTGHAEFFVIGWGQHTGSTHYWPKLLEICYEDLL